eukprot:m.80363 g.80363  ORF g.80363 m.80363 type:complete len:305 (-) comp14660_c2_seq1:369-1283(-)
MATRTLVIEKGTSPMGMSIQRNVVAKVTPNGPAAKAGLVAGDRIQTVVVGGEAKSTAGLTQVQMTALIKKAGKTIELTVSSGDVPAAASPMAKRKVNVPVIAYNDPEEATTAPAAVAAPAASEPAAAKPAPAAPIVSALPSPAKKTPSPPSEPAADPAPAPAAEPAPVPVTEEKAEPVAAEAAPLPPPPEAPAQPAQQPTAESNAPELPPPPPAAEPADPTAAVAEDPAPPPANDPPPPPAAARADTHPGNCYQPHIHGSSSSSRRSRSPSPSRNSCYCDGGRLIHCRNPLHYPCRAFSSAARF